MSTQPANHAGGGGRQKAPRLTAAALATSLVMLLLTLLPAGVAGAAVGPNLAAGRPATAGSANGPYAARNATDGNAATYWESTNQAFPQWVQVDLGAAVPVNEVVLRLPASWEARTQTLAVQQSANGTAFTDVSASAVRTFDPASGNRVAVPFTQVTTRYVRVHVTANTGWPAGQLAELEVYGPAGGDDASRRPRPPASPTPSRRPGRSA